MEWQLAHGVRILSSTFCSLRRYRRKPSVVGIYKALCLCFFDEDIPEDVLKANADHGITVLEAQGTPSSSEIERDGAVSSADEE